MVNKFARGMLEGLFPQYCALCGLRSAGTLPLCRDCYLDLPANRYCCSRCAVPLPRPGSGGQRLCASCLRTPLPFSRVLAPWVYDERLAHLVQRWKFDRQWHLTRLLAWLWLQRAQPTVVDAIVPVPLHWTRLLHRGCNQSQLLLQEIRGSVPDKCLAPTAADLVKRCKRTAPQSKMRAPQRAHNLRTAFTVQRPCDNLRIAIVDDVLTTGATATSLAEALQAAGAAEVEVWCLARTAAPES